MSATIKIDNADGHWREVGGADTTIFPMPDDAYVDLGDGGPPTLAVQPFSQFLRRLANKQAGDLGEELHHAEFVITRDPAEVESRGSLHDCEECRAGVRRALRMMREEPGLEMVVGWLFWAAP